ncbi:MAG: hypothetical protein HC945_03175 [Nitrosarchaeum sp.]|nr:hypothetical protein [Nitrosarchaeum sp.]
MCEIYADEIVSDGHVYCSFECLGEDQARWLELRDEALI